MTHSDALLLLRANPKFEGVSDAILQKVVAGFCGESQTVTQEEVAGIKRHLSEFVQYYQSNAVA